jgi:hypothetical protein
LSLPPDVQVTTGALDVGVVPPMFVGIGGAVVSYTAVAALLATLRFAAASTATTV